MVVLNGEIGEPGKISLYRDPITKIHQEASAQFAHYHGGSSPTTLGVINLQVSILHASATGAETANNEECMVGLVFCRSLYIYLLDTLVSNLEASTTHNSED